MLLIHSQPKSPIGLLKRLTRLKTALLWIVPSLPLPELASHLWRFCLETKVSADAKPHSASIPESAGLLPLVTSHLATSVRQLLMPSAVERQAKGVRFTQPHELLPSEQLPGHLFGAEAGCRYHC